MSVDPLWSSGTAFVAQFQGSNGASSFVDDKAGLTVTGTGAIISTSNPLYGVSCGDTGDSGYRGSVAYNSLFNGFGVNTAFTIDFWLWIGTGSYAQYPICTIGGSNGVSPLVLFCSESDWAAGQISVTVCCQGTTTARYLDRLMAKPTTAGWHHIEVSQTAAGVFTARLNGVFKANNSTNSGTYTITKSDVATGLDIMAQIYGGGSYGVSSYMRLQNIRLTKGLERHTADFTPDNTLITGPVTPIYLPYVYA